MQCVEVTTSKNPFGYGVSKCLVAKKHRLIMVAHRVAFEQTWGIRLKPDDVVMHTCDNTNCVNPLHLQLGTQADNLRDMLRKGRHHYARRTHCVNGHEFSEENTFISQNARRCRKCGEMNRAR